MTKDDILTDLARAAQFDGNVPFGWSHLRTVYGLLLHDADKVIYAGLSRGLLERCEDNPSQVRFIADKLPTLQLTMGY